jgi:hypothetical protein
MMPIKMGTGRKSYSPSLEAGARGIPLVTTPISAFQDWGAGGILAEQWKIAFKQ